MYKADDYDQKFYIYGIANQAYEKVTDQYIEQFVIGSDQHERIKNENEVLIAKLEAIASGDKTKMLLAKHLEAELLGDDIPEQDFDEVVAMVEKHRGIPIDEKQMSVKAFYTRLNMLVKDGKEANKDNRPDSAPDFSGADKGN